MWPADNSWWLIIGARHIEAGRVSTRRQGDPFESMVRLAIDGPDRSPAPRGRLLQALEAVFQTLCAATGLESGRAVLRAVVSDRWMPQMAIPWSQSLNQPMAARHYLREQFEAAGFDAGLADTVRFIDAGYQHPALAVLQGADLLQALQAGADRLHVRLDSVQPLAGLAWLVARRTAGRSLKAVAVVDDDRISLLHACQQAPGWVPGQAAFHGGGPLTLEEGLAALWQRQRMRHPALTDVDPQVFDVAKPGEASNAQALVMASLEDVACSPLDGVQRPPRWSLLRVLVLAAAVVGAAAAVWHAGLTARQLTDAREKQAVAQLARPVAPATIWTKLDQARVQAINGAIRELNLPLSALVRAMLPPKDILVSLVDISISPAKVGAADGQATLSITADAVAAVDMTRYVVFLSERPTITSPRLVTHEVLESDPAKPYRFKVEMSWRD